MSHDGVVQPGTAHEALNRRALRVVAASSDAPNDGVACTPPPPPPPCRARESARQLHPSFDGRTCSSNNVSRSMPDATACLTSVCDVPAHTKPGQLVSKARSDCQ